MLGGYSFSSRFEEIEDGATSANSLTVEKLLDEPKKQCRVALFVVRQDGENIEKIPDLDKLG